MSNDNEPTQVKMVLPCQCPHCGKDIIIKLDTPTPYIEVVKPEDVDENIKKLLAHEKKDSIEEPQTT